jgi:DNA-directed RNA polymerase I, II, and III subunit RPABC1
VAERELMMGLDEFKVDFGDAGYVLDKINSQFRRAGLDFIVNRRDDPQEQLLVVFPDTESVGVKEIRKYCEQMVSNNVKGAIIVFQKGLTPSANKVLQTMTSKYNIETFSEAELMVNITKHSLVPQHQVLSAEEKKSLLER